MKRPKLLDLFCCEGGASAGYVRAGFDVEGVDCSPQSRYPYEFLLGDATAWPLDGYDAVHASPPCKDHTDLAALSGGDGTGWMLAHTIERVRRSGLPYVIENVDSPSTRAIMDGATMLCGSMFGMGIWVGEPPNYKRRWLKRHRLFLTSFPVLTPPDACSGKPIIGVYGTGGGGQMTRGYKATVDQARRVMEMPWASRDGVSQAIPPAYTWYLGELMMGQIVCNRAQNRGSMIETDR